MATSRSGSKRPRTAVKKPIPGNPVSTLWPSEAEQTLEALRAGLIDALVIPKGSGSSVYALRSFDELEAAHKDLLQSQERLLELVSERERLMQDLHDGCIQSIYAVGLALEECRGLIAEDPRDAALKVADAEARLNLVIQELRAFISGNSLGARVDLAAEIAKIANTTRAHGPAFRLDIDDALASALPAEHAMQLLQIAREAMSNVIRHANAKSGRISLRRKGGKIQLEIADDGIGFDANAANGTGLGLHHMAARAQKLEGRLRLVSSPTKGSRVVVEIAASR
jgi:signal transduction histidine kinase